MHKYRIFAFFLLFFFSACPLAPAADVYEPVDAFRDAAPGQEGINSAMILLEALNNLYGELQSDKKATVFFRQLADQAQDLEFGGLYENPFLKPWNNGYRGVTFQGTQGDRSLDLSIIPHQEDPVPPEGFGSFVAAFALKKNQTSAAGKGSFSGYNEVWVSTAGQSHRNIAGFLEGMLKVIDPDNLDLLSGTGEKARPAGSQRPHDVVATWKRFFPEFAAFIEPYVHFDSETIVRESQGIKYTDFTLKASFIMENIRSHFPALAGHMERLDQSILVKGRSRNQEGREFLRWHMGTQIDYFSMHLCTRRGKVIPMDYSAGPEGEPVFEESFLPCDIKDFTWLTDLTLQSSIYGLTFASEDIQVLCTYTDTQEKMQTVIKSTDPGVSKVSGRAFHVIPKWLINLFIPGDMDSLVRDFAKVAALANQGQGTLLSMEWDTSTPGNNQLHYIVSTEIIDNFYMRFASRTFRSRVTMAPEAQEELRALVTLAWGALLADLRSYRGFRTDPDQP